ncbi:MAG: hypothetical protein LBC69_02370 [Eubacteriaceae bacterium]|jgi:stage V sporulation protein AA|nr:hypothetical protein [Eubacteriaceae bacterium]
MGKIYLSTKNCFSVGLNTPVLFQDVCEVFSEGLDTSPLLGKTAYRGADRDTYLTITAQELLDMAKEALPECDACLISAGSVLVMVQKKSKQNFWLRAAVNCAIYALLFFGSALSVMYFHLDVGMLETQQEFAEILSPDAETANRIINVAYTIGLGAGMYLFFLNRRIAGHKIPSPIDLKMNDYQSNMVDFLREKIDSEKTSGNGKG